MKKILLVLFILFIPSVKAASDCEYFVLPKLGINEYQLCLQNPSNYSQYFIYHTVKFYSGTVLLKSESVRHESGATAPGSPSKSGYEFDGWNRTFSNITGDLDVYAIFSAKSYVLTYKDYNGNTLKQETVLAGEDGNPPTPGRVGYDFTGWSSSYKNVTSNKTLFATYEVKTFSVRFFNYSGDLLKTQTVRYNSSATPPAVEEVDGYEFTGWSLSYVSIKSSKDIHPVYRLVSHTVTFVSGDVVKVETVPHGKSATAPSVSKTGYTFLNWDASFDSVTDDITVNALFTINSYSVSFRNHLGEEIHSERVEYMKSATPPTMNREGYKFLGWDNNYSNITKNTVLKPNYEQLTYTVTFIDYDGTTFFEEVVSYGESCSDVSPNRDGYSYIGNSVDCSNVTSNIAVTLLYEANLYSIVFKYGEQVIKEAIVSYGECVDEPVFSLKGHKLTGWDSSLCNISSDATIRPILEANSYRVVFKDFDGRTLDELDVLYNQTASTSQPEREGYSFKGWSDSLVIKNNITLFAKYELNKYRVQFAYDGKVLKTEYVSHGKSATPPELEVEGFILKGWSQDFGYVTKNMRIEAVTEQITHQVVFKDYDMTTVDIQRVNHLDDVFTEPLERNGYIFTGWSGSLRNIEADITLIAQYEPKEYDVSLYVDGSLLTVLKVKYGTVPSYPRGYLFKDIFVYQDISVHGERIECRIDYVTIDGDLLINEICGSEVEAPLIEGREFNEWVEEEGKMIPLYDILIFNVQFIYQGSIVEVKVPYGMGAVAPTEIDGVVIDSWDIGFERVTSDLIVTGYSNDFEKPHLEIDVDDGRYRLMFIEDVSHLEVAYLVVDGEVRSVNNILIETDEISWIDKSVNWINITVSPNEVIDQIVFEGDVEIHYDVEDFIVERNFIEHIIHWFKSLFN